jgi:hypothetical protein
MADVSPNIITCQLFYYWDFGANANKLIKFPLKNSTPRMNPSTFSHYFSYLTLPVDGKTGLISNNPAVSIVPYNKTTLTYLEHIAYRQLALPINGITT